MLTDSRWQKEQELMRGTFPEFAPFMTKSRFGFEGYIRGCKSGRVYRVVLEGVCFHAPNRCSRRTEAFTASRTSSGVQSIARSTPRN